MTPVAAGAFAWQQVETGDDLSATWAPDSQHFFIQYDEQIHVFDRAGNSVGTLNGVRDGVWLTANTVQAYDYGALPPSSSDNFGLDQFYTVNGQSLDVSSGQQQPVALPCCYPISNGHGAVAITRYLPETQLNLARPSFVVWEDGQASPEREGAPVAWDASGDKLVLIHPTQPNYLELDGWLEVLSWPDATPLFKEDAREVYGGNDMTFDATSGQLAYSYVATDASDIWRMQIDVADLTTGKLTARIPVAGDSTKGGEGYQWNSSGQIMTFTYASPVLATYEPDGSKVGQRHLPQTIYFDGSSVDYSTVVSIQSSDSDYLAHVVVYRNGLPHPLMPPSGDVDNLFISPDGLEILVTVFSAGRTAYLVAVPL